MTTDAPPSHAGDIDLAGRLVLISGGAGALGTVIARGLVTRGAQVAVSDVLAEAEAVDRLGTHVGLTYHRADTTRPDDVERLVQEVATRYGRLPDAVCCHAGMAENRPIHEYPPAAFQALVNLNLGGSFLLAQAAARAWMERRRPGHLVFTSSWVARVPWPEIGPYNASKAALEQLARSFARELAVHGIRANCVAPGIVAAGMAQRSWNTDEGYRERARRAIPLGHLQPPQSVVDAFLFILSPMASYMTGSTLLVDGGASLYPMDPPGPSG